MDDITIEAEIISFRKFEAVAEYEGREIRIDPFVTDLWKWEKRDSHRGKYKFTGRWYRGAGEECFLPEQAVGL